MEFWNRTAFWNEGIPMGRSQRTSVGMAIFVNRTTSLYIQDQGILAEGQAQYVTFQSSKGRSLIVVNIYVQHISNEKASLWKKNYTCKL
jgi:hypothetical protein